MPLVPMFYDPNLVADEMMPSIINAVQVVLADELSTPDCDPLKPEDVLVRPIAHHKWAPRKSALEIIVSAHHYPMRARHCEELTHTIADRLVESLRGALLPDEDAPDPVPSRPNWYCFVQLELCEIGFAPFEV